MMPTFDTTPDFDKDYAVLDPEDKKRFQRKVRDEFIPGLPPGKFPPGLRVKGVHGARGVYEMTWAPDGRATFQYGGALLPNEPHIIWRRIGTHSVFQQP
jgi:hypothetical protein